MSREHRGFGSSVGIVTGYGLDGPGIESRWWRDFPPVQTGPGVHPASCIMGTGSLPGIKSGRGVTMTSHPLLVPWPRKSRAIPLLPYGSYGRYRASLRVQGCTIPYLYMWISVYHKLKRENQQDATNSMFIIKLSISTCFGLHTQAEHRMQ